MIDILNTLPDKVKGFLDVDEGMRLYEVAKEASRLAPCLEIGSYCGKSTIYIGTGCKESKGVLFSIDHHRGSEEQQPGEEYHDPDLFDPDTGRVDTFKTFRKTLAEAELESTVVPIVSTSAVTARNWATPLGMVFIDGGHSFEATFTDYASWSPHLVPGGYLVIHDIFPDPAQGGQAPYYIYQLALLSGLFEEVSLLKTLAVLRRVTGGKVPETVTRRIKEGLSK